MKFNELSAMEKEQRLMETAMMIQEIFCDMSYAHHLNPDKLDRMDRIERLQEFSAWAREFENQYCGSEEYELDFIGLIYEYATKKITAEFGNEEDNEDEE